MTSKERLRRLRWSRLFVRARCPALLKGASAFRPDFRRRIFRMIGVAITGGNDRWCMQMRYPPARIERLGGRSAMLFSACLKS